MLLLITSARSFDADPLTECDDEYWDTGDPETDFKQPAERPSKLSFMNGINRLMQIMAFALRTLVRVNPYSCVPYI